MNRQGRIRIAMLLALFLVAGLSLLRPRNLWAQGDQPRPQVFLALASGFQEVPPVDTPATAFARFIVSADRTQLFYEVSISGLQGKFAAMHLHKGHPGENKGVAYPLTAPPVGGVAIGFVPFNAADFADLMNQGFYFNIHTDTHGGGEIRSQVVPAPAGLSPTVNP